MAGTGRSLPGEKQDHVIASNVDREWLEGENKPKNPLKVCVDNLFPENRASLVTVKKKDHITTAFKTLIDHKILSCPVYDVKEHKYVGFIDMVDMVSHALNTLKESEIMGGELPVLMESKERFGKSTCGNITDLSRRNPWKPVDKKMPITAAIELMVRWKVHQIPVVDTDGELLTLITQSHVVKYFNDHIHEIGDWTKQTIEALKLGVPPVGQTSNVVSVTLKSKAIDAFKVMNDHAVSGVAVVNDKGELVGNISVSDLKLIGYDAKLLSHLFLSVEEFLKLIKPNDTFGTGPIAVLATTTFEEVVAKMVMAKVHRLYVVDLKGHPIGVISQYDALVAALGEKK